LTAPTDDPQAPALEPEPILGQFESEQAVAAAIFVPARLFWKQCSNERCAGIVDAGAAGAAGA
jgi:hypothetical protein